MKSCRLMILPGFYVFLAFGILLVPLRWLIAWLTAAFLHELFHIFALKIVGCSVEQIEIGMSGARIKTGDMFGWKMAFCAMAGPVGGFLLLLLLRIAPRLALCGLIQSVCNLIPVYPLDGGRALMGMTEHFLPEKTVKCLEDLILLMLICCSLYGTIKLRLGLFPLILVGILIFRNKKIPCKHSSGRVQ